MFPRSSTGVKAPKSAKLEPCFFSTGYLNFGKAFEDEERFLLCHLASSFLPMISESNSFLVYLMYWKDYSEGFFKFSSIMKSKMLSGFALRKRSEMIRLYRRTCPR